MSLCSLVAIANPSLTKPAEKKALEWMTSVDEGNATSSWNGMSGIFSKQLTQEDWRLSIQGMHGYFGKAGTRKLTNSTYKTESYGAPSGDYVDVTFTTDYTNAPGRKEVVTMVQESSGEWKVAGFSIE